MSYGKWILICCVWGITSRLSAQSLPATATASVSAEIIDLVGTEQKGNSSGISFYAGSENSSVVLSYKGISVTGTGKGNNKQAPELPVFRVIGGGVDYSISVDHETFFYRDSNPLDRIRMEKALMEPLPNDETLPQNAADRYTLQTRLGIAANQTPGIYSPERPCRITINFN